MPDNQRPVDDTFSELFGRLPDPRARASAENGARPDPSADPDASASPPVIPPMPPLPPVPSNTAPEAGAPGETGALSRRALREQAARGATGPVEPVRSAPPAASPSSAPASTPVPSPDPAASAPAGPRAQSAAPAQPTPAQPTPAQQTPARPSTPAQPSVAAQPSAPAAPAASASNGSAASVMTLDDLFTEEKAVVPSKAKRKRERRLGVWIILGLVLVLIGGVVGAGAWVWNTYEPQIRALMGWEEPKDFEAGLANGEALVTISEGDGGQAISQTLFDAGVTKTPGAFYSMLLDEATVPTFYPGIYRLQLQMTSQAALTLLQDPASKLENSALLREGLTVAQSLPLLAEGLGIPEADFQAAVADPAAYGVEAASLEGWLFPAFYTFDPGTTAVQVIQALVDRTIQSLDNASVPLEDRQRILTIASIIQREARFEADFYKVSRVIQNRLSPDNTQTYGLLQMDSTAQYGFNELHDGTVSSSEDALTDDNPWNTYVHTGLPIGPIANPGDVAIDAAMHPVDGPWYYFVTVNLDTGETVFSNTDAEHEVAKQQWIDWCQANPDSGC